MTNRDGQTRAAPNELVSPHDALFFHTFSQVENAATELKNILPEQVVEKIDWDSLKVAPTRFVDPKLSNRHADILYSVNIGQQETYVHILFEHESEAKPWSLLQALRYQVRIWDDISRKPIVRGQKRLPPILTVILHHGETGFTSSKRFCDYFQLDEELIPLLSPYLVDFGVVVDDIGKVETEGLVQRPISMEVQLILFVLRFARTPKRFLEELPKMASVIQAVHREPDGSRCIGTVFLYVERVAKIPASELSMALEETLGTDEALIEEILYPGRRHAREMKRLTRDFERVKREAARTQRELERSKAEAERSKAEAERSKVEAERQLVLRLLGQRFGVLPVDARARVEAASLDEIEAMAMRVLTAATLEEVLDKPGKKAPR